MLVSSGLSAAAVVSPPASPAAAGGVVGHHHAALLAAAVAANQTVPIHANHGVSNKQEDPAGGGGVVGVPASPPSTTTTVEYFGVPKSPPPRTLSPPFPPATSAATVGLLPPSTHHPLHHHPNHRDIVGGGGVGVYECGGGGGAPLPPPSLLPGAPREGLSASLLGGKYLLLEETEGGTTHKCVHIQTNKPYVCKVIPRDLSSQRLLSAHYLVDGHPNINTIQEVVIGVEHVYLVLPASSGDLHSYVRSRRRLREASARQLFRQVVAAVHEAHTRGIVLRDLKLRKFVFSDESRVELKLESLEDAVILEDPDDDVLQDKHGCPAYVSPEILKSNTRYSGRAADMWGLGVMLYTMLVGRYPFHGAEHSGLFAKIRRGQYNLPDNLSSRARCLIKCLLRKEPEERLTTEDVLSHPWLTGSSSSSSSSSSSASREARHAMHRRAATAVAADAADQAVPEYKPVAAAHDVAGLNAAAAAAGFRTAGAAGPTEVSIGGGGRR